MVPNPTTPGNYHFYCQMKNKNAANPTFGQQSAS